MTLRAQCDRLRRCREGAVLVEFSFLAPIAFAMLFSVIEGGRMYWMKQTLDEVAYATARCTSVSSECDTTAHQKAYAVQRAADYAVPLQTSAVTVAGATTCHGIPASNQVTITRDFESPLGGLLPFLPQQNSATACFPVVT
jgi:Flp pilus assembly protein TadG